MHEGHRQRIIQRLEGSGEGLQDHELLEILLFNAIPRKNTNDIAHSLIDTFGSLHGVLHATPDQLRGVKGVGPEVAAYIRCNGLILSRIEKPKTNPIKFNLQSFSQHVSQSFSLLDQEVIEIFCLDASERVKTSRRFTSDSANKVQVRSEEINRYIVNILPAGIVAAHNHPEGTCRPSEEDDRFTAQLMMTCSINNVKFYDHLITGKDGVYSYFRVGKMEDIRKKYHVNNLLGGAGN
ncbi:MAG: hypothetical protein K2J30_02155 [Clostridia bacterium]|nr:hypothetical protein [Clostridia bacterium]